MLVEVLAVEVLAVEVLAAEVLVAEVLTVVLLDVAVDVPTEPALPELDEVWLELVAEEALEPVVDAAWLPDELPEPLLVDELAELAFGEPQPARLPISASTPQQQNRLVTKMGLPALCSKGA